MPEDIGTNSDAATFEIFGNLIGILICLFSTQRPLQSMLHDCADYFIQAVCD